MKRKRYTEQQILEILAQLEARTPYGGMTKNEIRKFRQLEAENQRLKKLVAALSLDNAMLK